jgi:hypothetical protein
LNIASLRKFGKPEKFDDGEGPMSGYDILIDN